MPSRVVLIERASSRPLHITNLEPGVRTIEVGQMTEQDEPVLSSVLVEAGPRPAAAASATQSGGGGQCGRLQPRELAPTADEPSHQHDLSGERDKVNDGSTAHTDSGAQHRGHPLRCHDRSGPVVSGSRYRRVAAARRQPRDEHGLARGSRFLWAAKQATGGSCACSSRRNRRDWTW
jgi:hypothetical protein